MITTFQNLLNSGSKALNVDGTTPKTFSYTAVGTQICTGLVCVLKDEGSTSFGKFGAISALANGVLIQAIQNGNTRTVSTIKDNADLCCTFHFNQFGNGAVLSILSAVTPEGFGASNNAFIGFMEFHHPIDLANGDVIQVVIQDNLSNIDIFQISARICLD